MAQQKRVFSIILSVVAITGISTGFAVLFLRAGHTNAPQRTIERDEGNVPSCDAAMTLLLLNKAAELHPLASWSEGLLHHREISYDPAAKVRECECEMLLNTGENAAIRYRVSPQFNRPGDLQVFIHPHEELPSCSDPLTRKYVQVLVNGSSIADRVKSIDGFRELDFDEVSHTRRGECIAHTETEKISLQFSLTWQNRQTGEFQIGLIPAKLPEVTSRDVAKLLEEAVREHLSGEEFTLLDDLREEQADEQLGIRVGQCTVSTAGEEMSLRFFVEWKDEYAGILSVRMPDGELPLCTSDSVLSLIDQVIASMALGTDVLSIDGHREISYDPDAKIRIGECILHTSDGRINAEFTVAWQNEEFERFQVHVGVKRVSLPDWLKPIGGSRN